MLASLSLVQPHCSVQGVSHFIVVSVKLLYVSHDISSTHAANEYRKLAHNNVLDMNITYLIHSSRSCAGSTGELVVYNIVCSLLPGNHILIS